MRTLVNVDADNHVFRGWRSAGCLSPQERQDQEGER